MQKEWVYLERKVVFNLDIRHCFAKRCIFCVVDNPQQYGWGRNKVNGGKLCQQ